jgi:uncharacterized protein YdeI (YjbR/CyaY-like superfamily)
VTVSSRAASRRASRPAAPAGVRVRFFATPAAFREWLMRHHRSARELWVGFHKKATGRPSLTWPEAVDEALCFGWIDGIRKSLDGGSYANRFTPRKPGSTWSLVNTRRATELIGEGRMQPVGLAAFAARDPVKSGVYSFEQRAAATLDPEREARFKANRAAWSFFQSQPPGYRKTAIWWVISAKREETRSRRLTTLIADSAACVRIGLLRRPEPRRP